MNIDFNWNSALNDIVGFFQEKGVALLLSVLIIVIAQWIIVSFANRYIHSEARSLALKKWARYITVVFIFMWIVFVYGINRQKDFFFIIGIFLAAVAISLRDVFSNIVGWLIILSSRGFRAGQRIGINGVVGDVIDIGILRTVIAEIGEWVEADQSTGRLVTVPNGMVLQHPVYNYTEGHDFIWDEFKVLVTFESDWQKAEKIISEYAAKDFIEKKEHIQQRLKSVRKRYLLRYNYISPNVYVTISDSGILLTLRYLVRARRRRTLSDVLARDILVKFSREHNIDFAYPTVRIFGQTGKDAATNPK